MRSLEVRWIFPGRMGTGVVEWLARFPHKTEHREDIYLINPGLRGLSVKIRAGAALEVKQYRGSAGMLRLPGRADGAMESWHKWSFPITPLSREIGDAPGWRPVGKSRRICRLRLTGGQLAAGDRLPAGQAGCTVELTAVRADGQAWWSLGFEATGPAELLRDALDGAATLMFAQPMPDGLQPGLGESRSYAQWLSPRAWAGREVRPSGW